MKTVNIIFILFILTFIGCNKGTTEIPPEAPSNLKATLVNVNQVDLEWIDKSTNEIGFKIERKTSSTTFSEIASIGKNVSTYSDKSVAQNTTYYYRAYSYNSSSKSITYSNEVQISTNGNVPSVQTTVPTVITLNSFSTGGNVFSDGLSNVTSRGVVWGTSQNPTISLSTKTIDGQGLGIFTSNVTNLVSGQKYFIRAYAINSIGTGYGNEITVQTLSVPILKTWPINLYTFLSATSGGEITNDGGSPVTEMGIVWSNSPNPTVGTALLNNDLIKGSTRFWGAVNNLTSNTKYYLRAYAKNLNGIGYGNEISFTNLPMTTTINDIDGNVYPTTTICNKVWTSKNLDVKRYRNGDAIHQVQNVSELLTISIGAWCYYQYSTAYGLIYGKLYNWYAIKDPRGLAPLGYHIPSETEWISLKSCIGTYSGNKLKSTGDIVVGTGLWNGQFPGTNEFGFSALPGGSAAHTGFNGVTSFAMFGTSTPDVSTAFISYYVSSSSADLAKGNGLLNYAYSIRCVKD